MKTVHILIKLFPILFDEKMTKFGISLRKQAKLGNDYLVKKLLNECNSGELINEKNRFGWTALFIAARDGHAKVVQTLLKNGAKINIKSDAGWTALHVAATNGRTQVVHTLLDFNAKIDEKTSRGWTALHFAAKRGHSDVVKTLLVYGALIDEEALGFTALHVAQWYNRASVVAILSSPQQMIAKERIVFVRDRALQVCIGLQSLQLDALRTCEILLFACGHVAQFIPFHIWWNIAITVKHFCSTNSINLE
jgi:hypothetical protein